METYILVMFILYILGIGIKLIEINKDEYPRVEEKSKSNDFFLLFIGICFAVWTGYLVL